MHHHLATAASPAPFVAPHSCSRRKRPSFVAAEVEFYDQAHLTRHFRRLLGVTPAVYARST
ncbi:hypothetical protein [Nocardioides astragali]|uniref:HTH araC/xylS-type domain-containing protein n=1 Tax=Nocardioides astragali TaxID=1776736 RepID=A0ABW2N5Z0_9ACTN|nr:hypothetical protein [Nocardioides astragali]